MKKLLAEYLQKVKDFQTMSNQTVNSAPTLLENHQECVLRFNLMREENEEYLDACDNENI